MKVSLFFYSCVLSSSSSLPCQIQLFMQSNYSLLLPQLTQHGHHPGHHHPGQVLFRVIIARGHHCMKPSSSEATIVEDHHQKWEEENKIRNFRAKWRGEGGLELDRGGERRQVEGMDSVTIKMMR